MPKLILTDDEVQTIVNGLRVAAERFDEHRADLATMPEYPGNRAFLALAQQFERQKMESLTLAAKLET